MRVAERGPTGPIPTHIRKSPSAVDELGCDPHGNRRGAARIEKVNRRTRVVFGRSILVNRCKRKGRRHEVIRQIEGCRHGGLGEQP